MGQSLGHLSRATLPLTQSDALGWEIGRAVLTGVLLEVSAYPKPGLVTPRSMGSHRDMNLQTFMLSSAAIAPCLFLCAEAGRAHGGAPEALLPRLREIGCRCEEDFLAATQGVNTHRGMLFSVGVLCAAAGLVSQVTTEFRAPRLFDMVARMTTGICARELIAGDLDGLQTAGRKLYRTFGVLGIRGEVEAGFPTVANHGLPALRAALEAGVPLNVALVHTLMALVEQTEDTTVLWRSGPEGLEFIRSEGRRVMKLGGALTEEGMAAIYDLDRECVGRNISPGGSADLLAITVAVYLLENGNFATDIVF